MGPPGPSVYTAKIQRNITAHFELSALDLHHHGRGHPARRSPGRAKIQEDGDARGQLLRRAGLVDQLRVLEEIGHLAAGLFLINLLAHMHCLAAVYSVLYLWAAQIMDI